MEGFFRGFKLMETHTHTKAVAVGRACSKKRLISVVGPGGTRAGLRKASATASDRGLGEPWLICPGSGRAWRRNKKPRSRARHRDNRTTCHRVRARKALRGQRRRRLVGLIMT